MTIGSRCRMSADDSIDLALAWHCSARRESEIVCGEPEARGALVWLTEPGGYRNVRYVLLLQGLPPGPPGGEPP